MRNPTPTVSAGPAAGVRPGPPVLDLRQCCLFLDVDGTLAELQPEPAMVRIDASLRGLLQRAQQLTGGALALISGRPIAGIDTLFAPLRLPCAGVHGAERRSAAGRLQLADHSHADQQLQEATDWLQEYIGGRRGLLIERKPGALALHFRQAPQVAEQAQVAMGKLAARLGPEFELLAGDKVIELKPAGSNKATAVEAFMREAPFADRRPVYAGDDITDLDGLAAVRRVDGYDIAVGERISARWHLDDPVAVRAWLAALIASAGTDDERE